MKRTRFNYLVLHWHQGLLQQPCGRLTAFVKLNNSFIHCNLVVLFSELLQGFKVSERLVTSPSLEEKNNVSQCLDFFSQIRQITRKRAAGQTWVYSVNWWAGVYEDFHFIQDFHGPLKTWLRLELPHKCGRCHILGAETISGRDTVVQRAVCSFYSG